MLVKQTWHTPLAEGCYMVGRRNANSLLQCNTYLRTFGNAGGSPIHWCVDPGSQIDYPEVKQHLLEHIGDLRALRMFSINHQDPDVVGNLAYMTEDNDRMHGIVTEDVWRLVQHLNIKPRHLVFANKAQRNHIRLGTGQQIIAVPTPFCHFRGAMAFFDPESQILFSGDLFGGLNAPNRVGLYGEEADWPGIAQFHQIYMPTNLAVAHAIRQIRALQPAVKVIAPQHGFVLTGEFMQAVMDRLEKLPVGMNLLPSELDERYLRTYREAFDEVLIECVSLLGRGEVMKRLRSLPEDHELLACIEFIGENARLVRHGLRGVALLVDEFSRDQFLSFRILLKDRVLAICTRAGAPLPQLGIGFDEIGEGGPISMAP